MKSRTQLAIVLAAGAVIGALGGILLAPKVGAQARKALSSQPRPWLQRMKRDGNSEEPVCDDYAEIPGLAG